MDKVKTILDLFYDVALMAFNDGHIALYVSNEDTADELYKYCFRNAIEMDFPNGEGRGIQSGYTYKIKFIEFVDRFTEQIKTRRILSRHKGADRLICGVDIIGAENIFKPSKEEEK